jgi:hypothetical protein
MPMKNPPHPGGFALRQCIEPMGLTITQAAALGVTRTTLSELVNKRRGIFLYELGTENRELRTALAIAQYKSTASANCFFSMNSPSVCAT